MLRSLPLTVIFIAPPLQVPMVERAYACARDRASAVRTRAGLLARAAACLMSRSAARSGCWNARVLDRLGGVESHVLGGSASRTPGLGARQLDSLKAHSSATSLLRLS